MSALKFTIRLADSTDLDALCQVETDIFDNPVRPELIKEFLDDPRHHLALAYIGQKIVGMASAVHYLHPDKNPQLFINEVGVATGFQSRGIGRALIKALLKYGKSINCAEAWVATNVSNVAAQRAYIAAGGKEAAEPFVMYDFVIKE